jgi:site-specific recombinase XerD
MINKMKTLYWLRKNKLNANNEAAIYCRVTVNGTRGNDFTTNVFTSPQYWDAKKQRIKNNELKQNLLNTLKQKLATIHVDLEMKNIPVTADGLVEIYKNNTTPNQLNKVVDLFENYIKHYTGKHKKGTLKSYHVRLNLLKLFLQKENRINIAYDRFTVNFAKHYFEWLIKKESHNYSVRAVQIIACVFQHAFETQTIASNPLASLKLKKQAPKNIVWLTPEEIEKLRTTFFISSPLQKTADLFLFQCYTGFDYGDLMSVTPDNIQSYQGDKYLIKNRLKSNEEAIIPYTQKIDLLWRKHNYQLPHMENQTYNRFLKEVAAILEIKKRITSHIGRKTFTMNMLNEQGYSMEATSKMAGHSTVKTTEAHYAKVNLSLIRNETVRLGLAS